MTTMRFRSVDEAGGSARFENIERLREAYQRGRLAPESLLYDATQDRWIITRDCKHLVDIQAPRMPAMSAEPRVANPSGLGGQRSGTKHAAVSPTQTSDIPMPRRAKQLIGLGVVVALVYLLTRLSSQEVPAQGALGGVVASRPTLNGVVTNYGYGASVAASSPTSSGIVVDLDSSYRPNAFVSIALPLAGSGAAGIASWSDTIVLVSVSESGDSIVWVAGRSGQRFEGSYLIFGGPSSRQGGRWWVELNDAAQSELAYRPGRPKDAFLEAAITAVAPFDSFPLGTPADTLR